MLNCRKIRLNSQVKDRLPEVKAPKPKLTYTKGQSKQRQEDKKERRRAKRQSRHTNNETRPLKSSTDHTDFPFPEATGETQHYTSKLEVLETIEYIRDNFARILHNKDTSDPTVKQVLEEFSETDRRYHEWEDRFLYRIDASAYHSAEVSFVGEETAYRCGWHVRKLLKKKALTGTDGAVATGIVDAPIRIGRQTLGLQLFVSPHVEDFLVLGRDVVSRVLVCDELLLLTLVNGEVVDTLSADPFSVLFEVTYLDESDGWRFGEPRPEIGALETEIYSPTETIEIIQLHQPVSGTVPSIVEDLATIWEEEDLPRMETREPVFENERSHENTSHRETEEAVRTTGEVHFGSAESVDGPTIPFPVLGVIAESADEPTHPSPTIQF